MFRSNVDSESLRMEKLLFTGGACMGQMPLVLFHMVVHRVLVLLYLRTDGTDKLASSILLIDVRHL